ncbi:hypothetical protein [Lactococcus formosensis]|uniref:hypothetical protein n=1 Tax=Lactococcus formosensis TaxID=1281486 RepID=UPI00254AB862|nr:hypothetical protein [Lactococcus formosensis]
MFDGTSWKFRILYFITAMSPAYFLFIFTQLKLDVSISLGIFIMLVCCTFLLKNMINKRVNEGVEISKYRIPKIEAKNGEISSFLLGVILPSVIGGADNFRINIMIFIVLQFCLFLLMIKSSSILPNVPLILFGLNIFEMSDGKYIISFRKQIIDIDEESISITRLGDSRNCNTYIRKTK